MIAARILASLAFLVSGTGKAADPLAFAASLLQSPLIPQTAAIPLAFYLPWLEIALALGLWIPPLASASRNLLLLLLATFSAYLAAVALLGHVVPCDCFGGLLPDTVPLISLLRNAILAAAVWLSIRRTP